MEGDCRGGHEEICVRPGLMIAWSHPSPAGFTIRGEHSPPSGKPVLHFLHGNGYCGRVYWPMLRILEASFDIFVSDMQGHGDTGHGGRFRGWNRTAELVLDAWHARAGAFGGAPRFALGHSFGGVITSLILAGAPGEFQRAMLLDPVLFTPIMIGVMALSDVAGLYHLNTMARKARKRRSHWPDRVSARSYLCERGMFRGWTPEALDSYVEYALRESPGGGVELKCQPGREAEIFGSFPRRLWKSLARVKTPVRVEYGEASYPFVAAAVKRWQTINPAVSSARVPGGHCFMQQYPEAAAERVKTFFLS